MKNTLTAGIVSVLFGAALLGSLHAHPSRKTPTAPLMGTTHSTSSSQRLGTVHRIVPGEDIQRVIDAAEPGDTVLFAPGRYRIGKTILLKSRLRYRGEPGAVLSDDFGGYVFKADNASGIAVENLTFDARQRSPQNFTAEGVFAAGISRSRFVGNTFKNMGQGIDLTDATHVEIRGNTFDNLWQAVSLKTGDGAPGRDNSIIGNTVRGVGRFGIEVEPGPQYNLRVDGNSVERGGQLALSIVDDTLRGAPVSVSGNTVTGSYWAIEAQGRGMTVHGNKMTNVRWGISVCHTPDSRYSGNVFVDTDNPWSIDGGDCDGLYGAIGSNSYQGVERSGWQ